MTKWTDEEVRYLKRNYLDKKYSTIADELDRTTSSVKCKASKLGLKKQTGTWEEKEVKFLKQNYGQDGKMTAKEISKELDRSVDSVQNKIKNENLSYVEQKSFSDRELEYLKNNYKTKTHEEMAEKLDRHKQTITDQLNRMNLIKTPFYEEEELEFIEENWKSLSDHEIADKIGRSVISVRKKRRSIGLKRSTFVNTEKHWDWEEACEKAAKEIYNYIETQRVMDNGLRPDIFVPDKNLVIDAKTSCYRGLNDLKKYKKLNEVDKVVVWSMRPVKKANNSFEVLDKNDLNDMVSFDIKEEVETESKVKQTSIQEVTATRKCP